MNFERQRTYFQEKISKVTSDNFDALALELFRFQARNNPLYAKYLQLLGVESKSISTLEKIPFLPISLFKNHTIKTDEWTPETTFSSSGTTGQVPSQHKVRSIEWYKKITEYGFQSFYGKPEDFCFLALLPSYLERQGSSLVLMADHFIKKSRYDESGFFLDDLQKLSHLLKKLKAEKTPTILLGVSFGLLDFVEEYKLEFSDLIVMETGGMKGRRKEMTRAALHKPMTDAFGVPTIHSEYGMTELFSQAYSQGEGRFFSTPTMKIYIRDISDPFEILSIGRHGVINIVDLANLDTCAFIATDDLGRLYPDNSFEVLGRMDGSDIRGCNLMVADIE